MAEEIVFEEITTGASNDIEQATKLAKAMITRFGMNEEIGMVALERVDNIYLGGDTSLQCSEAMAEEIDRKVIELVKKQQGCAKKILEDNIEKLHQLAKHLYEKEVLSGAEFMELLNS